jgi:hypothetical protein
LAILISNIFSQFVQLMADGKDRGKRRVWDREDNSGNDADSALFNRRSSGFLHPAEDFLENIRRQMEMDDPMANIYIQECRSGRGGHPLTKLIVAFIAIAATATCGTEPLANGQKSVSAPVLVELFTSEGCSSCPPADKLLAQMDNYQAGDLGPLVVLSEHVDYWDHDGWKDPYSESSLTDRQSEYEKSLGSSTVYTPQLIVDGAGELKLSDPEQVKRTLLKASSLPKIPISIGSIQIDAGEPIEIRAEIEVDGSAEQHNSDVYMVVALNRAETQVLHGENAGRVLTGVAVCNS